MIDHDHDRPRLRGADRRLPGGARSGRPPRGPDPGSRLLGQGAGRPHHRRARSQRAGPDGRAVVVLHTGGSPALFAETYAGWIAGGAEAYRRHAAVPDARPATAPSTRPPAPRTVHHPAAGSLASGLRVRSRRLAMSLPWLTFGVRAPAVRRLRPAGPTGPPRQARAPRPRTACPRSPRGWVRRLWGSDAAPSPGHGPGGGGLHPRAACARPSFPWWSGRSSTG